MTNQDDLSARRLFTGTLTRDGDELSLGARIHIDDSGEIVFAFDPVPHSESSHFLLTTFHHRGSRVPAFHFSGVAPDGTRFSTEDFHLVRCPIDSDESGTRLPIEGSCLTGIFHRPLLEPSPRPLLRMHLRGFENY